LASALILSLLAVQGVQMMMPSAVNVSYPVNYSTFPAVEPKAEMPTESVPEAERSVSVSTDHFTVQLAFPESAEPGKSIAISAKTTANANKKVSRLSIEIYTYVDQQLAKTGETTVLKDLKVRTAESWQTTLTVSIPLNAQRSTMIGTVTEVWEETVGYYGPSYFWPYYPYVYPPHLYNYTVYYLYSPSYVVTEKSSQETIPLTYVLATTPEYEQLLTEQKQLQQDYDTLVANHNELSSQYESLKGRYNQLVSAYEQLELSHSTTVSELGLYRFLTYILAVISIVLGAGVVVLFIRRQKTSEPQKKKEE